MKKRLLMIILLALLIGVSALTVGSVVAQDSLTAFSDMPAGEWTMIEPGGETICAYGTPFKFFVRPADTPSDKLMIHFEGGGACWDQDTCAPSFVFPPDDPNARPLFAKDISDEEMAGYTQGLFDFDNPENPVADYNTVFIPYCTGDIHMGNTVQEYTSSSGESYTMHHKGFVNASTVLDWTYANFENPSDIFITGISAGALGQVLHTPYIMDHYKDSGANIVQFADSYVGVVAPNWAGFGTWGAYENRAVDIVPAYADMTPEKFTIANLYKGMAPVFPEHTFSEFSSYVDTTQIFFYFLTGGGATPEEAGTNYVVNKQSIMNGLTANLPNFRAYQSWGNVHGITPINDFYAYQVKGVRLRDWLADLLVDEPVRNVSCSLCTTPELYTP
jgi:hypothetical protein